MSDARLMQQVEQLESDSDYEKAFELCTNALNKDSKNADLLEKTAMLAKIVGNRDICIDCWERLLEITPSSQLAYSELQDLYFDTDKFKYYSMRAKYRIIEQKSDAAIDDFKKAIANTDDEKAKIDTMFMIASIYKATGRDEKASNQYLSILDIGANSMASLLLAEYYMTIDDIDAAIDTLNTAYKSDPDNLNIKRSLGNLYMRAGDMEKAKEFVTDDFSNIKLLLGQGKNDEAKGVLDNFSGQKNADYYLLLAEYYYNTNDTKSCFEAIDEFAKQAPKHPLIFQMRALCHELDAKNADDADKKHSEARAKYNWGWYNLIKGQQDIALSEFLDSNELEKNIDTIDQIIKIYDLQKDCTIAAEFVEQLVELEPRNTLALKRLGEFYQSVGDFDRADEFFERILEYDPNNLNVLTNAAKVAEKIGKETEAMEYYKRIAQYSRDDAQKSAAEKRLRILNGEEDDSIISRLLDWIKKF